ncbi:MAG: S-layer homology domain-containing protein [Thermoanaerobaculia bacterium]|nr:S-layer homology domain-containing protein [Thermoanaerobaculia bacterium]
MRRAPRLRTHGAVLALALFLHAIPASGAVSPGGPLPHPLPLFPSDNWWNTDVSQAPVDPASASFISFIGVNRSLHPDFGGNAPDDPEIYGMVTIVVPGDTPLEPVAFDYADESDYGAPGRPSGYPIPVEAKTQPRWIEGGYPGNSSASGDKHMLIVDRDNGFLFETWNTRCLPAGSPSCSWRAGSGAVFSIDSNARRPDGWTSADAAGLAILPGLIRYDEAFGPEPIRHAFRVTVRSTNGYVFPASHRAGSTTGALPMGARLRLKASKDISGYSPHVQKIFQAMKTYGLIVADNGSDMYIQGTHDTRWNNDVLNPAFSSLKASDFEVLQLGWQPSCPPAPSGLTPANGTPSFTGSSLSWSTTAGGPVSFDILFDTVNPPEKRLATVTGQAAGLPPLFPATTYYWKVIARNGCGSASSPVSSFTTGACSFTGAPPLLTSPAGGATGLGTTVTLTWQGVPGANRYEILFGTASPPQTRYRSVPAPALETAVKVNPGTLYYWQVVAYPGCGTSAVSSSSIRSFSTAPSSPALTTLSPFIINRWTGGSVALHGTGFTGSTLPFTDLSGDDAGAFRPTASSGTQISGVLEPVSRSSAGLYDAGIAEAGVEKARLPRGLVLRAFTDVFETDWYFESSSRMADTGIMEADFDGNLANGPQFGPLELVTRARMADYLARAYMWWRTGSTALTPAACTPSGTGSTDFPDVPCSHPQWLSIHWIKTWGVTIGAPCPAGLCYNPANTLTRAEAMTFLERLKQGALLPSLLSSSVGDIDPGCTEPYPACSGWTDAGMKTAGWPRREGNVAFADRMTTGCGGTPGNGLTLCVFDPLNRSQIGELLARSLGLVGNP